MIADAEEGLTKAAPLKSPPPKNVREAYGRVKVTTNPLDTCAALALFCGVLCGTLFIVVLFVALSFLHLYLLIVGSLNVHNCPEQPYIPIFLIVTAVFAILRSLAHYYYRWAHPKIVKSTTEEVQSKPSFVSNIINLFLIIWFFCGCAWVFRAEPQFAEPTQHRYCDQLTYYSAYVYIIISLVLLGVALALSCCMCCCAFAGALFGGAGKKPTPADTTTTTITAAEQGGEGQHPEKVEVTVQ